MTIGWNVHGANVHGVNVYGASCPWGRISMGQDFMGMWSWGELPWGELSLGRDVHETSCYGASCPGSKRTYSHQEHLCMGLILTRALTSPTCVKGLFFIQLPTSPNGILATSTSSFYRYDRTFLYLISLTSVTRVPTLLQKQKKLKLWIETARHNVLNSCI